MLGVERRTRSDFWHLFSTGCLTTFYVLFAVAHIMSLRADGFRLSVALLVVFESVMVVMIFLRRQSSLTDLSAPALAAGAIGSLAPLLLRPVGAQEDPMVAQVLLTVGALFLVGSSLSLGRSFGIMPANRGVKTDGLYRFVRHPFYLSYLITQSGYLISNPSVRNGAIVATGTAFQIVRIRFEEQLLGQDRAYAEYAKQVRWHLVPGVW